MDPVAASGPEDRSRLSVPAPRPLFLSCHFPRRNREKAKSVMAVNRWPQQYL